MPTAAPTRVMKNLLLGSVRLLRPLARAALRNGITAYQFSRWADEAFVREAAKLLEKQGLEPSFSRVAALTGIHRHAVSQLMKSTAQGAAETLEDKEYQRNRLARVLTGWFEDPNYTDESGRPLVLPQDGPQPSFSELARAYSGDIYPGIILGELIRVGAARIRPDQRVEALSRRYTSGGVDSESLRHLGIVAGDVIATLEHNMVVSADERLFEDASISLNLPREAVPMLARLLERRGTAFLDDLDGWLASAERAGQDRAGDSSGTVRAGVRLIMIAEDDRDTVPIADGDTTTGSRKA